MLDDLIGLDYRFSTCSRMSLRRRAKLPLSRLEQLRRLLRRHGGRQPAPRVRKQVALVGVPHNEVGVALHL